MFQSPSNVSTFTPPLPRVGTLGCLIQQSFPQMKHLTRHLLFYTSMWRKTLVQYWCGIRLYAPVYLRSPFQEILSFFFFVTERQYLNEMKCFYNLIGPKLGLYLQAAEFLYADSLLVRNVLFLCDIEIALIIT